MSEVTQNLIPCERPTFAHLRALRDLTSYPEAAQRILFNANRYFNFCDDVVYCGFARERDQFDSPLVDAPDFTIQVWHGERVYRTLLIDTDYVGILHVLIPDGADPGDYFVNDPVGKKCNNLQRPDLAPACIGYLYGGRFMVRVPELRHDDPINCFA